MLAPFRFGIAGPIHLMILGRIPIGVAINLGGGFGRGVQHFGLWRPAIHFIKHAVFSVQHSL